MKTEYIHEPVMPREVLEGLALKADGVYLDGTLGEGGHSELILRREPRCRVIACEQDAAIAEVARMRLAEYGDRIHIHEVNFEELPNVLREEGVRRLDGILLDLGISSFHYEAGGRGFSFQRDEALDMRLGVTARLSAADVLRTYSEDELVRVFRDYGEERYAARIARAVVRQRADAALQRTQELASLITKNVPAQYAHGRIHPATRVFQALRIEVNRELDVLRNFLDGVLDLLLVGARLCVISFHSLEDRIVKQYMRGNEPHCVCPRGALRCTCGCPGKLRAVPRRAITADAEEVRKNPRARSARLRVAERIEA
ncbi:MAG: 16S rRNA (cytosine(1402)-N(4))-methyltransferase RsmH [Spirochaetota bacterium]|jgi:16S rRNA (cytosine1402-N4)-methyltransferase|nr:16S rRNA (cytosine(1402)-N(4))-methyltransferase RsmH [Spirochaetota bacterium]